MKYLILIYGNPATRQVWEGLSEAERFAATRPYAELNAELVASGEAVAHAPLDVPERVKRVSVREGRVVTSDGPFAEAKEFLAGFYVLECDSLDRAVECAARIPEAEFGLVEVRPTRDLGVPM